MQVCGFRDIIYAINNECLLIANSAFSAEKGRGMEKAANVSMVRIANYKVIWNYLRGRHSATIPQISRDVGLSLPTVTRAIEYGRQIGMLCLGEIAESERGRKAQIYTLNADYMHVLLLYSENETLYFEVRNFWGSNLACGSRHVENETILSVMEDVIDHCLKDDERIAAVCAALTGAIDNGTVMESWGFPSLNGFNLRDYFEKKYGRAAFIENNMRAAAYVTQDYMPQASQGATVIYSFGEESYGAAVVVDGTVLQGANGAAAEIGDVPIRTKNRDSIEFFADHLQTLVAVLNPHSVVLYPLDDDAMGAWMQEELGRRLSTYKQPKILFRNDFSCDCLRGLILVSIEALKNSLS